MDEGKWTELELIFKVRIKKDIPPNAVGLAYVAVLEPISKYNLYLLSKKWIPSIDENSTKKQLCTLFINKLLENVNLDSVTLESTNLKEEKKRSNKSSFAPTYNPYFSSSSSEHSPFEKRMTRSGVRNQENSTKNKAAKSPQKNILVILDSDNEAPSENETINCGKVLKTNRNYETPPRPVRYKSSEFNCVSVGTTSCTCDNNNDNNNNTSYYSNEQLLTPTPQKFHFESSSKNNKRKSSGNTALAEYLASQRKLAKSQRKNSGKKVKLVIGRTKIGYHEKNKEHYFFVVIDVTELQRKTMLWSYNGDYMVEVFKILALEVDNDFYATNAMSLFRRDDSKPDCIMTTVTGFPMKGICLYFASRESELHAEQSFDLIVEDIKSLMTGNDFFDKYKVAVEGYYIAKNDGSSCVSFLKALDAKNSSKQDYYWLQSEQHCMVEVSTNIMLPQYFTEKDIKSKLDRFF